MDTAKLSPILNKESILKTANARELAQAPQDVLSRYLGYALTHVALGDTTKQLNNLERVVAVNKTCAVGTIVGPYGYGKTSTAVHLWSELRDKNILSVPPFLWTNLPELMDAVYYWIRFEFSQGAKAFIEPLDGLYASFRQRHLEELSAKLGEDNVRELLDQGRLLLDIRPEDVVGFYGQACELCEQAGYRGLAVFTDELQVTIAEYKPSRDQFFNDLFQIVKDILGLPGHWALVVSMNDDTEAIVARLRADLLQRMQASALYFRVKDVYNRREYPAELWSAFEKRFCFDGSEVVLGETLESIGEVAARSDLGSGPRMVTNALSLAVKHFERTSTPYTPIKFVDDFLAGQLLYDQRGKFVTSVRKALDNRDVKTSESNQQVIKLLAAFPMGSPESMLRRFDLWDAFQAFPPLARRELVTQLSGGYILRYLAEEEIPPEQIEQRLTKEFVTRYAPGKTYAEWAAEGFFRQVLIEPTFASGWRVERQNSIRIDNVLYRAALLRGTFDSRYPERSLVLTVAAVSQSSPPKWQSPSADAEIELRFELNFALSATEPSRLLVSPKMPNLAVFQLNLNALELDSANKVLPQFLHEYYSPEQLTPLLALSLVDHLYRNRGELPDDQSRVSTLINPLRQYALSVLIGDHLETSPQEFASSMVGTERVKELFRQQVRRLYPDYRTLITGKAWKVNLQQYNYALEKMIADDGLSIARGRRPWKATKEAVADALQIPGRRLTNLDPLLDALSDLIVKEDFSGRSPGSEVSLRFQLHVLESDWIEQIEASKETVRQNGMNVPAMPAEFLMRQAKRKGYTDDEVVEIIRLLRARKFVEYDQKQGFLVRNLESVVDAKEAVAEQIARLESQINVLSVLPDFEAKRYPVERLRAELDKATERDEVDNVKSDVRNAAGNLSAYANSLLEAIKNKFHKELNDLSEAIQIGLPEWLEREYDPGPFQELLEVQRRNLATAFQSTLDDIRLLRDEAAKEIDVQSKPAPEMAVELSRALIALTKKARKLQTRLKSYDDRRDDLAAWHEVSGLAFRVQNKVTAIERIYGDKHFVDQANGLFAKMKKRFESDPLSVLGAHGEAREQITLLDRQIANWLRTRREDFEVACQSFRDALVQAGITGDIEIPFDPERPQSSYAALHGTVSRVATAHIDALMQRTKSQIQIIRYGKQVQGLTLDQAEEQADELLVRMSKVIEELKPESVKNQDAFRNATIPELVDISAQEKALNSLVQTALQPRAPEGAEVDLLNLVLSVPNQQTDLRELIMRMIDQGSENVNLDALMKDLESLFQKNQIAIRVSVLRLSGL